MIVVDSSVWIDHFRNVDSPRVHRLRSLVNPNDVLVGDIVMLEVLRGARDNLHARGIQRELEQFAFATMLDADLAVIAARNYRSLRALGHTIRTVADLIIASYCLKHDHELLHSDRDFLPFEQHMGLRTALA